MKKTKSSTATGVLKSVSKSAALTDNPPIRYGDKSVSIPAVPCTIHTPMDGGVTMSDRAYILIEVAPGLTSQVVRQLAEIKQVKNVDPCWGKPDIIATVEIPDQDALTQLVLSRIHSIEGVTQTDTHLVYRLKEAMTK